MIDPNDGDDEDASPPAFTSLAFARTPCSCPDSVWLCGPCGHAVRTRDQQYALGWTWRTRYSSYLGGGGLGSGIGEGLEGVKCGLGDACRGGHDVEREECGTAEELAELGGRLPPSLGQQQVSHGVAVGAAGSPHDEWSGTSFFAQEIEGIGGRRVMKVKRRVRVGAVVKEWEDERDGREAYLAREKEGKNRAWCAWCARVVPSERDARELRQRWGFGGGVLFCGDGRHARG